MSKIEAALDEFRNAHSFKSKGQLAVALHITRLAKTQGLPLDPDALVTEKTGQVAGLSKGAVQAILKDHGIVRVLAEEGGHTSRGSLGNMREYVTFLNQLHAKELADLDAVETWWVGVVKEYFNSQPFTLRYDPTKSLGASGSHRHNRSGAIHRDKHHGVGLFFRRSPAPGSGTAYRPV